MCNDYRLEVDIASIAEDFEDLKIKIKFSEGTPNLPARSDVKITDPGLIVRAAQEGRGYGDLVQRRWSWPGTHGKPVYNFQADGRDFRSNRCLIVTDGFYEFTTPVDPKQKRKDKWLFTRTGEPLVCIAGIWRKHPEVGEAFTMLTTPPGPDMAGIHKRQVAVLRPDQWADWLDCSVPAAHILDALPVSGLERVQIVAPPTA